MTDYWAYEIDGEAPSAIHVGVPKGTTGGTWACRHEFDRGVFDVQLGATGIETYVKALAGGMKLTIEKYGLEPGAYHPRMWRGGFDVEHTPPADQRSLTACATAMAAHLTTLYDVFRVVEPHPTNDKCYGHLLRHVLILACTEVEASWVGVLRANNYPLTDRPSTSDYVKLHPVLRLDQWSATLLAYPDYPSVSPFQGWRKADPTKSLPWYNAYNSVKHDREKNLADATLRNAIVSCAAMLIMGAAQFGTVHWMHKSFMAGFEQSVFEVHPPKWSPGELFYPPERGQDWKAVSCAI